MVVLCPAQVYITIKSSVSSRGLVSLFWLNVKTRALVGSAGAGGALTLSDVTTDCGARFRSHGYSTYSTVCTVVAWGVSILAFLIPPLGLIKLFHSFLSLAYRGPECSDNLNRPTTDISPRERCQIIGITITNNNFRLRYVSSKLDQVLLLLLLTNKL
jgi:hypothetical protein